MEKEILSAAEILKDRIAQHIGQKKNSAGRQRKKKDEIFFTLSKDREVRQAVQTISRLKNIGEGLKSIILSEIVRVSVETGVLDSCCTEPIEYYEFKTVCGSPMHRKTGLPVTLSRGLFKEPLPLRNVFWTDSNLIYMNIDSYKNRIRIADGKIHCKSCEKLTGKKAIAETKKGGDYNFFREKYDQEAMYRQISHYLTRSRGVKRGRLTSVEKEVTKKGFSSLITFLQRSKLTDIIYSGLPKSTPKKELKAALTFLPDYRMIARMRIKESLADKLIQTVYMDKDRSLFDFIGARVIVQDNRQIYAFKDFVKLDSSYNRGSLFQVVGEKDRVGKRKDKNGYESYSLDILLKGDILGERLMAKNIMIDTADPLVYDIIQKSVMEMQIRTNRMDNKAEEISRDPQSHAFYRMRQDTSTKQRLKELGYDLHADMMRRLLSVEYIGSVK